MGKLACYVQAVRPNDQKDAEATQSNGWDGEDADRKHSWQERGRMLRGKK